MKTLFWFRRDLRLDDNVALYNAVSGSTELKAVFIFDTAILEKIHDKADQRISFIYEHVCEIKKQLQQFKIELTLLAGNPREIIPGLLVKDNFQALCFNEDYEPDTIKRDQYIQSFCNQNAIVCRTFCDHLIFRPGQIVKKDGTPYTVFTPYSRVWKDELVNSDPGYFDAREALTHYKPVASPVFSGVFEISSFGFKKAFYSDLFKQPDISPGHISKYAQERDYPAKNGTSLLGVHLRFGTISIREAVKAGQAYSETWLNELVWREFFIHLLYHFPHTADSCFRCQYDYIPWENDERLFKAWMEGKTGFPLVDAGMRELNSTGFMHNRVRMNVASFLTKYLLIDWRWGESYFFQKLMDYELASNCGNWQWAAGTGADAVPYFRFFNPDVQFEKYDAANEYVKKWVPEYGTSVYPARIIDLKTARDRAIQVYKSVK